MNAQSALKFCIAAETYEVCLFGWFVLFLLLLMMMLRGFLFGWGEGVGVQTGNVPV